MQCKLSDGSVMVQGTCTKDAEFVIRGENHTHITNFSLAVGKNKDTTTIFANCKAFGRLANIAAGIRKGDSVLAVGKTKSREYNGKTYTDLLCDWIGYAGMDSETPPIGNAPSPESNPVYGQQTDLRSYNADDAADDDLPF
jgi:single-strand binding family protein